MRPEPVRPLELFTDEVSLEEPKPRSVCVVLGSFDPPHLGHEWIFRQLLRRFELLVVLLPRLHFDKRVIAGVNASLAERQRLLGRSVIGLAAQRRNRGRVLIGQTAEVLLIRLIDRVAGRFPGAQVFCGIGADTQRKLARSARYFARLGLPWGDREQRRLALLRRRLVVFARTSVMHEAPATAIGLPPEVGRLSSTLVRSTVGRAWRRGDGPLVVRRRLEGMVSGGVAERIASRQLYPAAAALRRRGSTIDPPAVISRPGQLG